MPQGRRKVPYSGKAKKAQLQSKKRLKGSGKNGVNFFQVHSEAEYGQITGCKGVPNRYALLFHPETEAEIREQKEAARKSINPVSASGLEIVVEDFFLEGLDFPKRPPWNYSMSVEHLEAREHKYFTDYNTKLEKTFGRKDLSYYELNLETWRQLWRVLEMSDIVLVIVDIRYCALMFPPSVYMYVVETLHKEMILILNKIDLAPAPLVVAWKHYFQQKYPALHILTFTSFPAYSLRGKQENKAGLQIRRRLGKLRMAAEGAKILYDACKSIVNNEVDLSSWHKKICDEMELEFDGEAIEVGKTVEMNKVDTGYFKHEKYKDGTLTIGCIGHPNVGKSSLMNAIMGKKVVSVSKTPGHTKHFQTIYLTPNVRLCDCPGLVFPSKVPKTLQILMGSFPISQLRKPFPAVRYLAERIDLPNLLKLQHPERDEEWSAMDICDGWALKRGFYTAHAARPDSYRAANSLLRMALNGTICLCLHPPGYSSEADFWEKHADVEHVKWIQAKRGEQASHDEGSDVPSSSEEEENGREVPEAGGDQDKQESSATSEESNSDSEFDVCNRFSALDTRE